MVSGGSSEGTRSPIKIFGNIFISFIGAGVLGLPYAFKEAGILEGCCILSFVGFLSLSYGSDKDFIKVVELCFGS